MYIQSINGMSVETWFTCTCVHMWKVNYWLNDNREKNRLLNWNTYTHTHAYTQEHIAKRVFTWNGSKIALDKMYVSGNYVSGRHSFIVIIDVDI